MVTASMVIMATNAAIATVTVDTAIVVIIIATAIDSIMKSFSLVILLTGLLATPVFASDSESLSSRSAGKLKSDQTTDLKDKLQQSEIVTRPKSTQSENYEALPESAARAGIANRHDQLFEIYEADVDLLSDLDADGFHHALNVYFDVDVSVDAATVYAKLYLSREGGPWRQYYTTDLFTIHEDAFSDAYEVETELLDGYTPGYYDVLIEIYSLDHAYMVTSEVLDYHYLGRDVALEDLGWDEPHGVYHEEVSVSVGAGDFSALLLFFLIIQVVIAARGIPALTPCKKRR